MGLETFYLSVFFGVSLFHYSSAITNLHVYTPDELDAIYNAYDTQLLDKAATDQNSTATADAKKDEENVRRIITEKNRPWVFSSAPTLPLNTLGISTDTSTTSDDTVSSTPNVSTETPTSDPFEIPNWIKLCRLLDEGNNIFSTLELFKIRGNDEKVLWKAENDNKTIVVICGYSDIGVKSALVGTLLYHFGYKVVVVGIPGLDGTRRGNPEFNVMRVRLMNSHIMHEKYILSTPTLMNSFKYIEINKEDIDNLKNIIPEGRLYLEGYMGIGTDFESDGTDAIGIVNFLKHISTNVKDAKIISFDGTVYLHAIYGIHRYKKGDIDPLPYHLPHGIIFSTLLLPFVLAPQMEFTLDPIDKTMKFTKIVKNLWQMEKVTCALGLFKPDIYSFIEKCEAAGEKNPISKQWDTNRDQRQKEIEGITDEGQKAKALEEFNKKPHKCPSHVWNTPPNDYEGVDVCRLETVGGYTMHYLHENLHLYYEAFPKIEY